MVFKYFRLLSYSLLAKQKSLIYRMRSIKYCTKVKMLNSLMERFNLKSKFWSSYRPSPLWNSEWTFLFSEWVYDYFTFKLYNLVLDKSIAYCSVGLKSYGIIYSSIFRCANFKICFMLLSDYSCFVKLKLCSIYNISNLFNVLWDFFYKFCYLLWLIELLKSLKYLKNMI